VSNGTFQDHFGQTLAGEETTPRQRRCRCLPAAAETTLPRPDRPILGAHTAAFIAPAVIRIQHQRATRRGIAKNRPSQQYRSRARRTPPPTPAFSPAGGCRCPSFMYPIEVRYRPLLTVLGIHVMSTSTTPGSGHWHQCVVRGRPLAGPGAPPARWPCPAAFKTPVKKSIPTPR